MAAFIFAIILAVLAIAAVAVGINRRKFALAEEADGRPRGAAPIKTFSLIALIAGGVFGAAAILLFLTSILYTQPVTEARVIVNVDGTVAGTNEKAGFGVKAPWQEAVVFDIAQIPVTYAGNSESGSPSYTDGQISGYEITATVKGGAAAYLDMNTNYSIDPSKIEKIYTDFRTQQAFAKAVVEQRLLSITRQAPSAYSPVEFRGEKRGEAILNLEETLASDRILSEYGVKFSSVNLQAPRFSPEVEASITAVETAQQAEQTAAADLRAVEISAQKQVVEAEEAANAERARAQGIADANAIINANPLSQQALQQLYLEGLGEGTTYVVPEGSTPFIQTNPAPAQ